MSRKGDFSSSQVLTALRNGPFRQPAHAWLHEVRNQTGYGRQARYADALVISLWPSRGLWIAGVEIKVDRADWKRELDQPDKSAEIQRFCDFWWVAAPPGIVKLEEVPETWGLLTAPSAKDENIVTKDAPRLTPEPLSKAFVTSILRNQAEKEAGIRREACDEAAERLRGQYGAEGVAEERAKTLAAERAKELAERDRDFAKNDLERLTRTLREFERAAGLPEFTVAPDRGHYQRSNAGEHFRLAQVLAGHPPEQLAAKLRAAADALSTIGALAKEAS